jgi:hypothetical protein
LLERTIRQRVRFIVKASAAGKARMFIGATPCFQNDDNQNRGKGQSTVLVLSAHGQLNFGRK